MFGGRNVIIDGGDGPEIITIDVSADILCDHARQRRLARRTSCRLSIYLPPDNLVHDPRFRRRAMAATCCGWAASWPALIGWDGVANPFATGHLLLAQSGADALILIDRDGGGNAYSYALFGRLQNVAASLLTDAQSRLPARSDRDRRHDGDDSPDRHAPAPTRSRPAAAMTC